MPARVNRVPFPGRQWCTFQKDWPPWGVKQGMPAQRGARLQCVLCRFHPIMSRISRALYFAFVSLLHPKMLALMLLPVAAAFALWMLAAFVFWGQALAWVDAQMHSWDALQWLLDYWPLTLLAAHAAVLGLALLMVPVILVTVLLLTGIFAMPAMVSHVGARNYAQLEMLWFLLLVLVTAPLWLLPPLWPFVSLGLLGYLNQRVLRYDALADHGTAEEIAQIVREDRWALFWLGVVVALAAHVPLLGFFAPVYGGLAFIHYGLARLRELRTAPIDGRATRVFENGRELLR